ncbi:MAG TPA: isoprenyl transferase [Flavobacterium sp.]|nr:isoprenyl transferase [Flavobacterium sp.]
MKYTELIKEENLPQHIGVIMDGNGRWAKKLGFLRNIGHETGVKAVRRVVKYCAELGVPYLTLYAFSTENWKRPEAEVSALMQLMMLSLKKEIKSFQENNIRLNAIGNLEDLPSNIRKELTKAMEATKDNTRLTVTVALSYGARSEMIHAVKSISDKVKNNIISLEDIDEKTINNHLYTHNLPDVDLLIRTSGEQRISNFLLWQIAYAELYFTEVLWPEFKDEDLAKAIYSYQNRERRFGKTSEQLKK